MKRIVVFFLVVFFCFQAWTQRSVVYDKGIHSLSLSATSEHGGFPVLKLGSSDILKVSFDDLTHDYRRFSYRIDHVEADFMQDEGLFDSEFMEADDTRLLIEDYLQSTNTTVLYNHYSFQLPNVGMRPLLSGNYRLTVSVEDENGDLQPAFETYFAVVDQRAGILLKATTNTDIDHNAQHQQLEIEVNHKNLTLHDPARELKIIVLQNGRWDNAVEWPKPTASTGFSLKWNYCHELIFPAGNEYRKFEQIGTRYQGMHVDRLRYFEPYYYISLMADFPRENYLYDEDQNGAYVYRADGSSSPEIDADYMWVLFHLEMEPLDDADIYVHGQWTHGQFLPQYKMKYNSENHAYEALVFLKQGYYSYQYLSVPHGGSSKGNCIKTEGNFFQTENNYTVLVYYRPLGSRYDQLVGWRTASYRPR